MTKNLYITENYATDHSVFGGLVYPSDFNTDYRGKANAENSAIASRILSDQRFDKMLKNIVQKKRTPLEGR